MDNQHQLAHNGLEAVDACRTKTCDVILTDLQMPEIDGLDATRTILAEQSDSAAPSIIALTANTHASDRERCTAVSMTSFQTKPAKVETIAMALRSAFQARLATVGHHFEKRDFHEPRHGPWPGAGHSPGLAEALEWTRSGGTHFKCVNSL